jgi:hypothetical protein
MTPEHKSSPQVEHGSKNKLDPSSTTDVLCQLGVSGEGIARTTVVIDSSDRSIKKTGIRGGADYKWHDRRKHGEHSNNEGDGSIVRVYENYRAWRNPFKQIERTPEELNSTLMHELEHVAQMERKDPRLYVGIAMMLGMAALGPVIGERVGKKAGGGYGARLGGAALGLAVGRYIGYKASPHEIQARKRAKTTKTSAISRQ